MSKIPEWHEFPCARHLHNGTDKIKRVNFEPLMAIMDLPAETTLTICFNDIAKTPKDDVFEVVIEKDDLITIWIFADPFYVYYNKRLVCIVPDTYDYANEKLPLAPWPDGYERKLS